MDEYISKQKVLDYLNGYLHSLGDGGAEDLLFVRGQRRALINSIQDILAVKAADVQPVKHGKWIEVTPKHSRCSVCDTTCLIAVYPISKGANYCPNCGTDMRGDPNV
jgi:hypothetical protein